MDIFMVHIALNLCIIFVHDVSDSQGLPKKFCIVKPSIYLGVNIFYISMSFNLNVE